MLVAAAIVALVQVRDARRLREEQARPFVVIDIQVFSTIAEFKITNIGSTLARDVTFEFTPALEHLRQEVPQPLVETALFKRGLPSLPPGKEITTLFDQLPERLKTDLPDDYDVRIRYSDPLGHRYDETMTVGVSALRDLTRVERKTVDDIHRRLEEIVKEMRKWTKMTTALKVMGPDDQKQYVAEVREEMDERRRQIERRLHMEGRGGDSD